MVKTHYPAFDYCGEEGLGWGGSGTVTGFGDAGNALELEGLNPLGALTGAGKPLSGFS